MQIKLEKLEKTYTTQNNSSVHAVNDISLSIPENIIYGIIGQSGAGKSSLVRLISLLEKPDSGFVYYDNKRVDNLVHNELILQRRQIGMIFQNFNLLSSRTAAKNVAYPLEICKKPKEEIEKRVVELLDLVGLKDRANAPISTLSGGQKQRIAIARALANNPSILFCDEATSALDPQTTRSILQLLKNIQKKMNLTVVMITHQMEVVRDACEQVAVLDEGKVVEVGSVEDLFSHPKTTVTKEFLSHLTENTEGLVRWSDKGGRYILRFIGEKTGEPVLSNLAKKFDIEYNIRAGGIQHLPTDDIGTMVIDITGVPQECTKAIEYLKENGVLVEEALAKENA
ncbi:MAG: phosphate ABC transporter ATP-binding protein [Treponema sp. CETP13]|nr:MAG: phosphate ABC transporter ATP-binding protein [Treponema sp. CETP13]